MLNGLFSIVVCRFFVFLVILLFLEQETAETLHFSSAIIRILAGRQLKHI